MTIEAIIAHYGLPALFLGAGLEGETVVMLGGLMAHRGLINPFAAAAAASVGSFVADQFFFLAGRRFRNARWMRRLIQRPTFAKAIARLERHPNAFILSFRFIYGLRTISPAAVGTSQISARRFLLLNLIAAVVWGSLFTTIGYVFGSSVEKVAGSISHVVIAALVLAVTVYLCVRLYRWWSARP